MTLPQQQLCIPVLMGRVYFMQQTGVFSEPFLVVSAVFSVRFLWRKAKGEWGCQEDGLGGEKRWVYSQTCCKPETRSDNRIGLVLSVFCLGLMSGAWPCCTADTSTFLFSKTLFIKVYELCKYEMIMSFNKGTFAVKSGISLAVFYFFCSCTHSIKTNHEICSAWTSIKMWTS